MKFALNGALTIGSMDGANVEIHDAVGEENIFIFGMKVDEVRSLREKGYDARSFIEKDPRLQRIIKLISDDFFSSGEQKIFRPLVESLYSDNYMTCADFASYAETQKKVSEEYRNSALWNGKCAMNIARMGCFSSDRSIQDYAEKIGKITPLHVKMRKVEEEI